MLLIVFAIRTITFLWRSFLLIILLCSAWRSFSKMRTKTFYYVGSWSPPQQGTFIASVGCLRYGILIASATWDLRRLHYMGLGCLRYVGSWLSLLRGTFIASFDRLRYGILIASAIPISVAMLPPLRSSLPNRSSLRACTYIAVRQA